MTTVHIKDVIKNMTDCKGKVYLPPNWISAPCGTDGKLCSKCRPCKTCGQPKSDPAHKSRHQYAS